MQDPIALLRALGAPPRLVTHGLLVAEAAQALVRCVRALGADVDEAWVQAGAILHDAGKAAHPHELQGPGHAHERAGETMLLARGVDARVARCCVSHAAWGDPDAAFEELLVALADKLWKGVRLTELETRVIDAVAARCTHKHWDVFLRLDSCFEAIADGAEARLLRSES
jgi:putative nucleotidyltransferase with HDIG domain